MSRETLFSLDIQTNSKVVKLPVLSSDDLPTLTDRLFETAKTAKEKRGKVADRLKGQLQLLIQSPSLSSKIRSKVKCLLNIALTKIEVEEDVNRSTETPFRILQDSILNAKINQNSNRQNRYQNEAGLNAKYQSVEVPEMGESYQYGYNRSPVKAEKQYTSTGGYQRQPPSRDNAMPYPSKYEQPARKYDDYHAKNIKINKENVYNDRHESKYEDYRRNYEEYAEPSNQFQRSRESYEMDRKFSKLNLGSLKIDPQEGKPNYPKSTSYEPYKANQQPNERRILRKFNYLEAEE